MQRGSLLIRFNLPKSLIPRTQCLSTLLLVGKLNYIFKKKDRFLISYLKRSILNISIVGEGVSG